MPSARLATPATWAADRTLIRDLFVRVVNGQTIRDEYIAEYGGCMEFTMANLDRVAAMEGMHVFLGFDDGGTLRGVIFARDLENPSDIEIFAISTDKRLTSQQRLAAWRFVVDWVTDNVPRIQGSSPILMRLLVGGGIYNYLVPRIPNATFETLRGNQVMMRFTAAEFKSAVA